MVHTKMDEKLTSAIEEFITTRINDHGSDAPLEVIDATADMLDAMEKLVATLTPEQCVLWNKFENTIAIRTGEDNRYYYKAGLSDALRLLGHRGV